MKKYLLIVLLLAGGALFAARPERPNGKGDALMKRLLQALLALAVVAVAGAAVLFWSGIGTQTLYTQIDNTCCVEIAPDAGMTHEYTLPAVDAEGSAEQITFRTERVLREGAYLKLTVAPLRGVTAWEEMQPDTLPQAAREKLSK